jgi:uncharacterized membrane protein
MRESVPSGVRRSPLRAAFIVASVAWAIALVLVPFLASRAHASAFTTALVVVVYSIGGLICHQLPERSYHLWAAQMPVCARCAGIYFGAAIAAVVAASHAATRRLTKSDGRGRPPSISTRMLGGAGSVATARTMLVVAALPSALTLVYEWTSGRTPGNLIRAAAGIAIGAGVAWLVVEAVRPEPLGRIR